MVDESQFDGPPMSPPPRTSSRPENQSSPANVQVPDRTRRRDEYQPRYPESGGHTGEDTADTAASAARSRRVGTGETDAYTSRASAQRPEMSRDNSEVIDRLVVTDPEVDIERERERIAEAVPSGEPTRHEELPDDSHRVPSRTRQDFAHGTGGGSSGAARKETKFGEYILGQTLGEGEFGKVKLGWKKDGSVQVAIKLIRKENLKGNPSRLPKIHREVTILGGLSHPNIVRLHEMVQTERYIGIILEYASGGELFDYILQHKYLKDAAARKLFAQLVSGVGYLHKKGIVHRDLKLENLLLDRHRNIIITDFGFANQFDPIDELDEEIEYKIADKEFVKQNGLDVVRNGFRRGDLMQTSCGSPCYAAPELVVTDSLYTGRKVDVWSCGVILVRPSIHTLCQSKS